MENVLKELCWFCQEAKVPNGIINQDTLKVAKTLGEYEDFLLERLKGKNLRIFKKMVEVSFDMNFHSVEDGFIDGAKIGAKLILELLFN